MRRPIIARVFNAISDFFAAGAILCLACVGAIWFAGCGGSGQPATAPSNMQLAEDCLPCMGRCAADIAERIAAAKASKPADAGTD